jgi:cytochrome c553
MFQDRAKGRRYTALMISWLALLLLLAACGPRQPDAERGRQIFVGERPIADGTIACVECHALVPGERSEVMGQNLSNIGNRAATTVSGQSAEEYLHTAILDPDEFLSGGYQEGIHPRNYDELLSDADVADLIAFMLTLQSGVE